MGQIKRRNVYEVPGFFFLLVFIRDNLDKFEDEYIYEYSKLFCYKNNVNKNQKDNKPSGQSLSFYLHYHCSQSFLSFSIKNSCFEQKYILFEIC